MQKSYYLYYIRCCCTRIDLSNHIAAPNSPQQIPLQEKKRQQSTLYWKLGEGLRRAGDGRSSLDCWLGMAVHLTAHAKCLQ